MATLAETVERCLDDLSRPDDELGTVVQREILSAIRFYEHRRFSFNERILTPTLSATNTYLFSALLANNSDVEDIFSIDTIKVRYSSRLVDVCKMPWSDLFMLDPSNITAGLPDFYAVFNKTLRIYPTPNTDLPSQMPAHIKLTTLAQDGDTNAWLVEGEELIRSRACRLVAKRKLDDFEKAREFEELERNAYDALTNEAGMYQSTGMLSPNG